jgi:hypothetical protein
MVEEIPDTDRGDHHEGHRHQVQADDIYGPGPDNERRERQQHQGIPGVQHTDELPRGCSCGQILAEQRLTGVRQRREEPEYEGGHPDSGWLLGGCGVVSLSMPACKRYRYRPPS